MMRLWLQPTSVAPGAVIGAPVSPMATHSHGHTPFRFPTRFKILRKTQLSAQPTITPGMGSLHCLLLFQVRMAPPRNRVKLHLENASIREIKGVPTSQYTPPI